jgi:ER lumen protein retaining receptor
MGLNFFRLCGDMLHLASFLILILKIHATRSVRGISLQTQFLYVVVFLTRYLDLFFDTISSTYNGVMKVIFITLSVLILLIMKYVKPICRTYEAKYDDLNSIFLILPAFVLALISPQEYTILEVLWTFSLYLEAVAILPQLVLVHRQAKETGGFVDTLSSHYVFALGGYRAFYLLNWIYRFFTETSYGTDHWRVWCAGLVQTAIFCDFFYYYLKAQIEGKAMTLPA